MTTKEDIYCLIYFPDLQKGFALDRKYDFITDDRDSWEEIKMGDIIEHDSTFFPTFDYQSPQWARDAYRKHRHIALWTNYYEGR